MAANPYDPVTVTDTTHLTDDDWGLSLPPLKYSQFSGTSRFKSLCSKLRRHNRTIMIAAAALFVIFLIIMIIAVVANNDSDRHPTGKEGAWENTVQGLVFYPVPEDKSIVISFSPDDFMNMAPQPLKKSLDKILDSYNAMKQFNEAVFTNCNISHHPGNRTCKVSNNLFGEFCTPQKNYGYHGGQPCVFIQLNLPENVTIEPIKNQSRLWEEAKAVVGNNPDPSYVPVTCQGTTSLDTEILESVNGYGPNGARIMYYPKQGLLSYIYRERDTSFPFLKPAIMIHFTKLVSKKMVHITCTAWGQLYDIQGKMLDHKLLSTQFALYVNHT